MSCYVMRYVLGPISYLGHEPIIPIPLLRVPRPIPWVWPSLPLLYMYIAPDLVPNGTLVLLYNVQCPSMPRVKPPMITVLC